MWLPNLRTYVAELPHLQWAFPQLLQNICTWKSRLNLSCFKKKIDYSNVQKNIFGFSINESLMEFYILISLKCFLKCKNQGRENRGEKRNWDFAFWISQTNVTRI